MKQKINIDCFHFVYDNGSRELVCTNDSIRITDVDELNVGNALNYAHALYSYYGNINCDYASLQQFYIKNIVEGC